MKMGKKTQVGFFMKPMVWGAVGCCGVPGREPSQGQWSRGEQGAARGCGRAGRSAQDAFVHCLALNSASSVKEKGL